MKGKYEQFGNTAVFLSGNDIDDILALNGTTGENGSIKKILNNHQLDIDKEIHDSIYTILAKYVLQMVNAAIGEILFTEIKPLVNHEMYFSGKKELLY